MIMIFSPSAVAHMYSRGCKRVSLPQVVPDEIFRANHQSFLFHFPIGFSFWRLTKTFNLKQGGTDVPETKI
jgi:hypothetical protein